MHTWMETSDGGKLDFLEPDPLQITIHSVAVSLSRENRFGNQTKDGCTYSVASHSIWVSDYLKAEGESTEMQLHGLLHDAHEAYTGDIPAPLKHIPEVRAVIKPVEDRIQAAIYASIDVEEPDVCQLTRIKYVDNQALVCEAQKFLVSRGRKWAGYLPPMDDVAQMISYKHFDIYRANEQGYVAMQFEIKCKELIMKLITG